MADDGSAGPPGGTDRPSLEDVVMVTNRGPLSFHLDDTGTPVAGRTAGGWPVRCARSCGDAGASGWPASWATPTAGPSTPA